MPTHTAAERLFHDNIALARFAQGRYGGMFRASREVSPEDVSQICLLGLWNAALRFDGNRGCRFSTFAVSHIRGELKKALRAELRDLGLYAASIDAPSHGAFAEGGEPVPPGVSGAPDAGEMAAAGVDFAAFLMLLPEQTRRVVACRAAGMRQAEIGRALGMSQVHVSRLLRDAARRYAASG